MLQVYKRMEAEGKIGQFDENGRPRPYAEYPKWITGADGKPCIVQNQREELAKAGESAPGIKAEDDPVVAERNRLAAENAKLRAELAQLAEAPRVESPPVPVKPDDALPPGVKIGAVQTKQ
jgi:hypothetical protein